ncbi:MAG: hypothetical protein IT379_13870 [Deltaproteobacteria bacterium]|nr:hypothetical protein [Deltaproteobacteria bacterium]
MTRRLVTALGLAVYVVLTAGCAARTVEGLIASSQTRIWVIRTRGSSQHEVYRCAEPQESGPPQPICARAPFVNEEE